MPDDEYKKNHIDTLIGKKLKLFRVKNGISQKDLSEKLGISFQQIQKYEKGINRISASRLWEICNIFNLEINHFLNNSKENINLFKKIPTLNIPLNEKNAIFSFKNNNNLNEIIEAFEKIKSNESKEKAILFVKSLNGK